MEKLFNFFTKLLFSLEHKDRTPVVYNNKTMEFEDFSIHTKKLISSLIISLFLLISLCILSLTLNINKPSEKEIIYVKHSYGLNYMSEIDSLEKTDSIRKDIEDRYNAYMIAHRPSSPLANKGNVVSNAIMDSYAKNKVIIPLELLLAQCKFESSYGSRGRSPLTNPLNVFEYDNGTVKEYKDSSSYSGFYDYCDIIARKYLSSGKTVEDLFINFVNIHGKRYASAEGYEDVIRSAYYYNKKWFEENY